MALRESTKTKSKMTEPAEPDQDQDAAEEAGLAIKQGFPILQVAVYDAVDGVNKLIELPKA